MRPARREPALFRSRSWDQSSARRPREARVLPIELLRGLDVAAASVKPCARHDANLRSFAPAVGISRALVGLVKRECCRSSFFAGSTLQRLRLSHAPGTTRTCALSLPQLGSVERSSAS